MIIRKLNGLLRTDNIGKVLHFYDKVDSTNTVLYKLAENGASEGTAVIADSQTEGKGRLDRIWISPPGVNLYISLLFRPSIPARESPLMTLLTAVAIVEALKKTGVKNPSIKWPNDVQIDGKKVAGILTEMKPRGESVEFIVVGIGININMTRATINKEMREAARIATSIMEHLGRDVDRAKFTADLLLEIESWYGTFDKRGKASILKEWTARWGGLEKRVRVSTEKSETFQGTAIGIDGDGHLLVEKDDGETATVIAGYVSVI